MDGNGRWAKAKGMPRNYGHVQGSKNVEKICEEAWKMGIKYLTVYAFSTENWNRPADEVNALMKLLRSYMKTCLKTAAKNDMKVRVIGDKTRLDDDIRNRIEELEEATKDNGGLNFRRSYFRLSGYTWNPGSGSSDPYKWGTQIIQLSALAACIYGILFYRCSVAGFFKSRTGKGD